MLLRVIVLVPASLLAAIAVLAVANAGTPSGEGPGVLIPVGLVGYVGTEVIGVLWRPMFGRMPR